MSERLRVGLLYGGASVEHEVSVVSARGISDALDRHRFECVPIAVAADGRWLEPEASERILRSAASRVVPDDAGGVRVVADPGGGGLLVLDRRGRGSPLDVDVVFSVVHGWGGEDGRFQGLLELADVAYVGAGVLGSAAGMDKEIARRLFEQHGLPVGPWTVARRSAWRADPGKVVEAILDAPGLPAFVKPANGGSSVGITKVGDRSTLPGALAEAFRRDGKAVVEKALAVREIECAVLGNDEPIASVPGEIVPSRDFYDYTAKYRDAGSRLLVPAPLDAALAARVRELAVRAFRALDLRGMARVDFFLTKPDGEVFVNEVNTLPGFTPISMYPKLWEASGLAYPELLARLVELALEERDARRERDATRTE